MAHFNVDDLELISKMENYNLERFKEIWVQKLNPEKFDEIDDYYQLVEEINDCSSYDDLFNTLSLWSTIDINKKIQDFIKVNHVFLLD